MCPHYFKKIGQHDRVVTKLTRLNSVTFQRTCNTVLVSIYNYGSTSGEVVSSIIGRVLCQRKQMEAHISVSDMFIQRRHGSN